jgi:uncharacterized protein YjbI with pentapeptide repeats
MANGEHVEMLRQGVTAWNKWRQKNPDIMPDLSDLKSDKLNLKRIDFSNTRLEKACLSMSNLADANFRDALLHAADLQGSNFQRADFSGADLSFANLSKSNLREIIWNKAKLRRTDLSDSDLCDDQLIGLDLRGVILRESILLRADLTLADLDSADLHSADLSEAVLRGTVLNHANLVNANLTKADLDHATLEGAQMTGVRLYGTIRDGWNIKRVECDYVHFDVDGKERTPKDRDFKVGEFAREYGLWSTFEIAFKKELDISELIALHDTVRGINETHPEWGLRIHTLCIRGVGDQAILSFDKGRIGKEEIQLMVEQEFHNRHQTIEHQLNRLDRIPEFRDLSRSLRGSD